MSDDEVSSCSSSTDTPPEIDDVDHSVVPPPFRAYIGGLASGTGTAKLTTLLQSVDPGVNNIHVAKAGNTGHCKGFAHCSFSTEQMRQKAIANLTGRTFNGRKIRVEQAGEHFMVQRREEQGDAAQLKERRPKPEKKAPVAEQPAEQSWGSQNWNSWGNESWNDTKVQQGTMKRWDPSTAAPAKPKVQPSARRLELEAKKATAVAAEDYAQAAAIKKELESEDKIDALQLKKLQAVESENFEEAGKIKKEIEALQRGEAPPAAAPTPAVPAAPTPAAPAAVAPAPAPAPAAAPAKPAPKKEAKPPKAKGGCKRCEMGKPCGKHNNDGPRCKKCKAGEACMKHKPEAALNMMQKETRDDGAAAPASKKRASPAASPQSAPKKAKKTPAAKSAAPKSMEELLGGTSSAGGFIASMDDEL
eukprot:TRINITY_DN4752_c0_g1_i1.p1 TRINITY_DN4752_c0_g1~~TRINITY_DN4752_c0_g1_i1.p1  ORF type:complete len:417 (+),score=162.63 TRINITY_DN4752_c0_g1_i1:58-1308(+)